MEIVDKNNKLIAVIHKFESIEKEREFVTDKESELQFASFNLKENTHIKRHKHLKQKRIISSTSETLIILEGELQIKFFQFDDHEFLKEVIVGKGDSILIFSGGHEITVKKDTKFVEVKQGPYKEDLDKEYF